MRNDPLRQALREVPIPVSPEAEERGLAVVEAAYAQRDPARGARDRRGAPLPRLAMAFAVATLLAALLLSPAGAAVRDWVGDVVATSTPRPEPGLADVPGGGRLLVQSAAGPWVVQPDGARRLLGRYEEAGWSPRGLYVAVAEGRNLSAVEPDGTPHWSITAPARVGDARWSPSGYRIAYRSGDALRVVAGDGTGDRLLAARAAPVAPSWSPFGVSSLAYISARGALRLVDSETGEGLASAPALPGVTGMEWGAGGTAILESSPGALRLRPVHAGKLQLRPRLGHGRTLALPGGFSLVGAALAPERQAVAAVATRWRDSGTRSSVFVFGPRAERPRRLLTVPGSLGEVAWSPGASRLLVAWPGADQWLFLPTGRGEPRAIAHVSTVFSPGERTASFPRVEGWCCPR
jgi:hypothetical protein